MINDDIRDVLARYATGSLTAEERKRLFDAALDDQELFEELAREDEMKGLFAQPGVRDRLIRALDPPKRRTPWLLALAPVAVLSALLMVILLRPVPKPPQQVAVATAPAPPAVNAPMPAPSGVPAPAKRKSGNQSRREPPPEGAKQEEKTADNALKNDEADQKQPAREAAPKAADQVATAAPAAPAPAPQTKPTSQTVEVQAQASQVQISPAGQQNAVRSARAMSPARSKIAAIAQAFGFRYSIQTAGHLIVTPSADGYLSVKSADGAVLFAPQRIAAGIPKDIVLPDSIRSVTILFSADATPGPVPSTIRTAPEGTAHAPSAVAIELKINP